MTPKKFKTRDVPRERYTTYLKRSRQFLNAVRAASSSGDWDAVGLNAVHCAISAADALLVYHGGVRSAGDSHQDAARLLELHVKGDETAPKAKSLVKIISYKHLAAYEDRELTETEAREVAKLAQRFLEWAQSRLV